MMLHKTGIRYDSAFKSEVLRRIESGLEPIPTTALRIGVHKATVYRWVHEHMASTLHKTKEDTMSKKRTITPLPTERTLALEAEVELLRLKVLAFETMIDIAESELGIVIRKKSFAKPSTSSEASTVSTPLFPASGGFVDGLATADKPTTSARQTPKKGKKGGK